MNCFTKEIIGQKKDEAFASSFLNYIVYKVNLLHVILAPCQQTFH